MRRTFLPSRGRRVAGGVKAYGANLPQQRRAPEVMPVQSCSRTEGRPQHSIALFRHAQMHHASVSETRARILSAALARCAGNLRHLPTVEDVVGSARISRGTFYKYFDSIEDVLVALGQDLTRLALLEGERFRGVFTEKWKSTSVVLRVVLTRALLDRTWAGFVLRTRGWVREGLLGDIVLQDLAEGRASGEYRILDDDVALDFLRGLLEACIKSLHAGVPDRDRYGSISAPTGEGSRRTGWLRS